MVISFEQLGWFFAWDKEGRYPVDPTQPMTVPDKNGLTLYLVNRKTQNKDGNWEEWLLISNGERQNCYYWYYYTTCGGWNVVINNNMKMKYQIIAGQKKTNFMNLDFSNYALEELFIGNNIDRENLFKSWPTSLKKITDYTDATNGCYIKFVDLKNKLGGNSTFGNYWITLKEIANYVDGVNYEMVDLRNNNLTIQSVPYKNNYTIAFLGRLLEESDSDIELYKDLFTTIYWNAEDQGIYMKNTPLVGELQVTKISTSPIFVDDNIYIALIKTGNKIQFNCNGNSGEIDIPGVDYLEEYVEKDDTLDLKIAGKTNKDPWSLLYNMKNKNTKNFTNWENRGNFINYKQILNIFPGETEKAIESRDTSGVSIDDYPTYVLYENVIEVTISNIITCSSPLNCKTC